MNLVIGGSGLVGSHVCLELLKRGEEVIATYTNKNNLKTLESLFDFYDSTILFRKIIWKKLDILNILDLQEAINNVNYVYHCAAYVSFNSKNKSKVLKTNIEGTANVVNACLNSNVKTLVYVSSTAALGTSVNNVEITEETPWHNNTNPSTYSISKYAAEMEVWRGIEEGLNSVIVNPSVIIGPGNFNSGSCALFSKVWNGLKFYTNGKNGFVAVTDVASCVVELTNKQLVNQKYLLVGENLKFKHFFETIANELNKPKATIEAKSFMANIAWRLEKIRCMFSNNEPVITKESAQIALSVENYSNKKIVAVLDFNFTPINEIIKTTCKFFKQQL